MFIDSIFFSLIQNLDAFILKTLFWMEELLQTESQTVSNSLNFWQIYTSQIKRIGYSSLTDKLQYWSLKEVEMLLFH